MITPDEYRQAGELFDRVSELPESEPGPALEGCTNNPGLRQRVLRLLEADRTAGSSSFLGRGGDVARTHKRRIAVELGATVAERVQTFIDQEFKPRSSVQRLPPANSPPNARSAR